jgi:phospholipase D1/2
MIEEEVEEESGDGRNVQRWIGKDFFNPFIKDLIELEKPFEDMYDRSKEPRMPWHDIASAVYGPAARDVARHFIQRYNFTKREQKIEEEAPYLLPRKTFSQSEEQETGYLRDILTTAGHTLITSAQVLRSVEEWSAGVPLEHSIMNAWVKAIEDSEHFVFIEQQFFISSLPKEDITNKVAEALRLRIARAYRQGQTFRVIIVMPLLPAFPAEKFGEKETAVLEAVLHWNYYTLSRGEDSLFGRLHKEDGIPEDEIKNYISVYGLRTHGEINGTPESEIVYVHSKLMVVDDRITMIGSANVNDRSMTGSRDSEVAIRFEDTEMIDGTMNGQPYQVGKFSHSIRVHLFKEHLGLLPSQQKGGVESPSSDISVEDPASDEFYLNTWMKAAINNTQLYRQVFGGEMIPTDKTLSYKDLEKYKTNSGVVEEDVERARETLQKIQGHVVELPLHFLEDEDLTPDFDYMINFAPDTLVQ